jgi:hypothetical protein
MMRPRVVAVVSAIAASIVAFLVVSRWRLAGTLTGAALIPLVYTLVSHWASEGLKHTAKWLRRRALRGGQVQEPIGPSAAESEGAVASQNEGLISGHGARTTYRVPKRGARRAQWLLVGFASLALAVSVYALASRPGEKVIVQERVVQKIITVTTQAGKAGPRTSSGGATTTTASGAATSSTTTKPSQTAQTGTPSSTTIASGNTTTSLPSSTTASVPPSTTASLP